MIERKTLTRAQIKGVCQSLGYSVENWVDEQFAIVDPSGVRVDYADTETEAWLGAFTDALEDECLYWHKKGGIYQFLHTYKSCVDTSTMVLYRHLHPHKVEVWGDRREEEFLEKERFMPIDHTHLPG